MLLVYIAGKMRADSIYDYRENIRKAEEVAIKWMQSGCAVICPHKNTSYLDGAFDSNSGFLHDVPDIEDDFFIQADFEIIKRVDAIIMMRDWEFSKGARAEYNFAEENGIPIVFDEDCPTCFNIKTIEDI